MPVRDNRGDAVMYPWSSLSKSACVLTVVLCLLPTGRAAADDGVFRTQVAPVLRERCLSCHNEQRAGGELSLTTGRDLRRLGYVEPGKPDDSHLVDVLVPQGGKATMPKDSRPLARLEVAAIRQWITQGAVWPKDLVLTPPAVADTGWWSLQPVQSPAVPESPQLNPVDAFLDVAMRQKGLRPVGEAGPRTLIRRLTYDLTGLPPTPQEVAAFQADWKQDADSAWTGLVDRLLATPEFGEKWAQHWLDVARYAETHGYDKDKPRENAWPWRDYVIRSLNQDKPYTRFVQEQVAGDVLFPGTADGVLGLGFLAAGPWDFIGHWEVGEGKVDGRIAKNLDRDEMLSAVFNVFVGTTVQCARCHHHKFDPVRMEDYYRLQAVFAAVDRADRVYQGLSTEQEQQKQQLLAQLDPLRKERDSLRRKIDTQLKQQAGELDRRIAALQQEHGVTQRPEFGWHSHISARQDARKWVQVDLGAPHSLRLIRLRPAFDLYAGIGADFGFPLRYRVEAANDPMFEKDVRLLHDGTDADEPRPLGGPVEIEADGELVRYVRVTATKLAVRSNDYIFALAEVEVIGDEDEQDQNLARGAKVSALDSIESAPRWRAANLTDGIFHRELNDEVALTELVALRGRRAAIEAEVRTPEVMNRLAELKQQIEPLERELNALPKGQLVYAAATEFTGGGQFRPTEGKPRPIRLLFRGDIRSPGDEMRPGVPVLWEGTSAEFFPAGDWTEGQARAELARWLTRRDNPLVWRLIVNRLWLWTFGEGLVSTPNDFGRMGATPSHPALLDFLAARLRDDPRQSLKSMIRLLVTSRAYRRASTHHVANAKIDAGNRYRWRAGRRRLTAEEFHDSLLAAAGVLRLAERGGPSYRDFVIEKPQHSPHYQYHLHDPDDVASHRRSVYRFVVRSQPQPLMTTLDCADPSISVPRRDESTTALQALAQWNNRFVAVMAERMGDRLTREAPDSPARQVDLACRIVLGRGPDRDEQAVLEQHLKAHGPASLARVLFNLNAFVYVD